MIEKYYNGVIEQVSGQVGKLEENYLLVRYNNDFSIWDLESVSRGQGRQDVFFSCHEFKHEEIAGGYEPFLEIICKMFRKYGTGSFSSFMEECEVYKLHRSALLSYYETGVCIREELILLGEVEYEQSRMAQAIVTMLLRLAEIHPIMIVVNRFQLASRSSMILLSKLLSRKTKNIGIVIGVSDEQSMPEFLIPVWDTIFEKLDDGSRVYHIGNMQKKTQGVAVSEERTFEVSSEQENVKIKNLIELLDFEQAAYLLGQWERRIKLDNYTISDEIIFRLWKKYAYVSIMTGDMAKALEVCEDIQKLQIPGKEAQKKYEYCFLAATAYMYLGRLPQAFKLAHRGMEIARENDNAYWLFHAKLLEIQIQMSGWCNIFFCAQDLVVDEKLLEELEERHYENHLANIYIYANDNKPEVVAKAYESEELLQYFSKGVSLAKKIGNEQLISNAYQKNIMIASTNGMYEISILYSVRTYEALKEKNSVDGARIFSGVAYNLCAMGQNENAQKYYDKAIRMFYELQSSEDIAEVQYNMSLNCIMQGNYQAAQHYLLLCMKAIEKLHLNSLRVCNLSKLYGLLALVGILQKNQFDCERYLYNCRQFLNYVFEKENMQNDIGIIHDYAKCDDDMFLYTFSTALLSMHNGNLEQALEQFEIAEVYLKRAEGNQFFSYALFRQKRMECMKALGKMELYEREHKDLENFEKTRKERYQENTFAILKDMVKDVAEPAKCECISEEKIETLLKTESIIKAYKTKKGQLDFISTWQKIIDVTGQTSQELVEEGMKMFRNHFSVDKGVYIRYAERVPHVLYNDTEREMTTEMIAVIEKAMKKYTRGFAVSKISSNYTEHLDVISLFDEDDVCSMVAIPFFNNSQIDTIFITFVQMKDNWHSSVNRYMLDDDDLSIYQLLWREVRYSLNRLDAYDKIFEMNKKLYLSAVTDQLTGIYNREGFYQNVAKILDKIHSGKMSASVSLMFVDLDNFKHYNDTFGHDIGDLILKSMAEIFRGFCVEEGFVCRYGGDEFILVFDTADKQFLEDTAKKIYQCIEKTNGFEKEIAKKLGHAVEIDERYKISCSIGISTSEQIQEEEDINNLIKEADELLYCIKSSTKGTYRI